MNALEKLLALSDIEKEKRGLIHTPREIAQQASTWRRTYHKILELEPHLKNYLTEAQNGFFNVLLVGAGTSDYIGKSVASLLQANWKCGVSAVPSTDLLTNMDDFLIPEESYLWISFSRSGDSSEGVAVLKEALERYPEVYHIIVTCNERGQMAQLFKENANVFTIVLDEAVNDQGLAMTSSFSNMAVVAQALANLWDLEKYSATLELMTKSASELLPAAAETCHRLVAEGFSKVCFLGSGPLKGAAIESALKVLELTNGRIVSFSESFLGLRHGPLSAIDSDTLVVAFLSEDDRRSRFERDVLLEIRAKGLTAKSLIVAPPAVSVGEMPVVLNMTARVLDPYRPPVDVVVGQLLGLFASLRQGLEPDRPSPRGAINRVVSNVQIY